MLLEKFANAIICNIMIYKNLLKLNDHPDKLNILSSRILYIRYTWTPHEYSQTPKGKECAYDMPKNKSLANVDKGNIGC